MIAMKKRAASAPSVSSHGLPDKPVTRVLEPTPETVARRAYEKFVARGARHGSDLQDWFEAERELKAEWGRGRA